MDRMIASPRPWPPCAPPLAALAQARVEEAVHAVFAREALVAIAGIATKARIERLQRRAGGAVQERGDLGVVFAAQDRTRRVHQRSARDERRPERIEQARLRRTQRGD